ncbi:MAG: hypothetical protein IKS85_08765 [Lachnospiraceae bacterium]|nr:hypothetical protein [Lachnospiraceae bacterium]
MDKLKKELESKKLDDELTKDAAGGRHHGEDDSYDDKKPSSGSNGYSRMKRKKNMIEDEFA